MCVQVRVCVCKYMYVCVSDVFNRYCEGVMLVSVCVKVLCMYVCMCVCACVCVCVCVCVYFYTRACVWYSVSQIKSRYLSFAKLLKQTKQNLTQGIKPFFLRIRCYVKLSNQFCNLKFLRLLHCTCMKVTFDVTIDVKNDMPFFPCPTHRCQNWSSVPMHGRRCTPTRPHSRKKKRNREKRWLFYKHTAKRLGAPQNEDTFTYC